jgi:DNA ligase 1
VTTLLRTLVECSRTIASTTSRLAKRAALSSLLSQLGHDEIDIAVGLLVASPRQGRFGVGWAQLFGPEYVVGADSSVTIVEVDERFTKLAATSGPGSVAARNRQLTDLALRTTATEWSFLVSVLTGEVRHGALDSALLDAAADATGIPLDAIRRAAMLSGSVGATVRMALVDGQDGIDGVSFQIGRPILPMLASPGGTIAEAFGSEPDALPVCIDWKLDGARVQIHRTSDGGITIVTRNLNDITHRLPGVVAMARSLPVTSCVLDGEVLLVDEHERPMRFQDTMSSFSADDDREASVAEAASAVASNDVAPTASLRAYLFDILAVDEVSLIDEPLSARLAMLERVAGAHRVRSIVTTSVAEAEVFAAEALRAGHEGVVIKNLHAPYAAGRRGNAWRKVKPVRTLDLVVLAAEWGHGRRTGWLSNLHLGARGDDGAFVMVGKTFKGLTDELLAWQTEQFVSRELRRTQGTVWVRPDLVVEIALDGVQVSTRYPGGVALRFARVKHFRPDKSAADADHISTLRSWLTESGTTDDDQAD